VRGEKDLLRLASHQITLSDQDTSLYQQLEARFKTAGFQALTYEEGSQPLAADSQKLRKLYQLLLQQQRLIKIGDFIFHREIIDNLLVRLRQEKTNTPKLDIAKFKEITGLSRKHAIPLLEYLDLHRITRRVGNDREIL
jgi:selenocysteine-specific elongation factor